MKTIPEHIAIIPDGNRRWAREHNLSEIQGHRQSVTKVIPVITEYLNEIGVKYVTFWGLSTENYNSRSSSEINNLFLLMQKSFQNYTDQLESKNVKIKVIGDLNRLPKNLLSVINKCQLKTEGKTGITVIFAINYGGRDEIVRAINKRYKVKGKREKLNEEQFADYLDTAGVPDPDIVIRTGKEMRLSGFMSWQSCYSELFFPSVFFPDFTIRDLEDIIKEYQNRKRRYGS